MQTSRFQLGLIATLAVGLGFSLASSDAVGYPAGAAVSMGTNPVWSKGGNMGSGDHVVVTADAGDLIVTDISLTTALGGNWYVVLSTDGYELASFRGNALRAIPAGMSRTLESGFRVPQGQSLAISWEGDYGAHTYYNYTLSGYYAQP